MVDFGSEQSAVHGAAVRGPAAISRSLTWTMPMSKLTDGMLEAIRF
jgi:hypothetical protein